MSSTSPSKPPRVTLPERLELEYMLDQRRLMKQLEWFTVAAVSKFAGERQDSPALRAFLQLSTPEILDEAKLRRRLRQLAYAVADQKVREVSAVIGAKVQPPSAETINRWIDWQADATREALHQWLANIETQLGQRTDADTTIDIIRQLAKEVGRQRENRASAALLQLNAEIIEETARSGGSSHYRWETERDDRVRPNHRVLDGKIYEWDKPPSGGGTRPGDKGAPGSGYGCRCIAIPLQGITPTRKPQRQSLTDLYEAEQQRRAALKAEPLPRGSELDTGYKGPLKSSMKLDEAERAIGGYKVEHAMGWDADGNVVFRQTNGLEGKWSIKGARAQEAVNRLVDTITHNHPSGNASLSISDILASQHTRVRVHRSVTASLEGMQMTVVNETKFYGATRKALKARLEAARAVVRQACGDAGYEYAYIKRAGGVRIKNPAATVAGARKLYMDTYAKEAFKEYGKVGKEYGFKIELIKDR